MKLLNIISKMDNKFFFLGAFGEVRKAIHKQTGMFRAIKVVFKSNLTEEETERLLYEMEILKHLVGTCKCRS
jgi:serine/threonine protein kinase